MLIVGSLDLSTVDGAVSSPSIGQWLMMRVTNGLSWCGTALVGLG
jgi:hypothetical protein